MDPELRERFNKNFSQNIYSSFLEELNSKYKYPVDFRVSETPIFLTDDFMNEIVNASEDILEQLRTDVFLEKSGSAIPEKMNVPNQDEHPLFLQLDFAVCKDGTGKFIPKLIELQGFPTLYCFQVLLEEMYRKHFNIPHKLSSYFNNLETGSYLQMLKQAIIKDYSPENVILLEIDPDNQKTRIDFACTEEMLGIKTVSLTDIIKKGNKLFYKQNEIEIPVHRIYNRVIFDELIRKNINFNFSFTEEFDVEWAGHPNWFYRISKHSLPSLKGKFVPNCFFLNDLTSVPLDLENYVLKPLYSFAGSGVEVNVTKDMINSIKDKSNYILQEKVEYTPFVDTPDEPAKAEIRMMFIWDKEPLLVNNLVRMSKGKMMGVDFNKDKTWIGSSLAYHS